MTLIWAAACSSAGFAAARTTHITLRKPHGVATAAAVDPARGFVYFATNAQDFRYTLERSGARLIRVRLPDFVLAGEIPLQDGENPVSTLVIDPSGRQAYLGIYGDPHREVAGRIVRIALPPFRRAEAAALDPGVYGLQAGVVSPDGKSAFFGTLYGAVTGVSLPAMKPLGTLALQRESNAFHCGVTDPSGHFGYFGTGSGRLMQVDLKEWLPSGSLTVLRQDAGFLAADRDPKGERMFLATNQVPAQVIEVTLGDFKVSRTLRLEEHEGPGKALYVDPDREEVYVVVSGDSPGVVRIASRPFRRIGYLPLPRKLGEITCSAYDAGRRRIYLGMGTAPARIVQIDLTKSR